MSSEIRVSANVACTNGNYSDQFIRNISVDQATANGTKRGITCTTSDTALSFADVSTLGYAVFLNQDATNYLDIGPTAAGAIVPMVRLKPGELAVLRLTPGITLRTQAHTASVILQAWVMEA